MHCPACGAETRAVRWRGLEVDVCPGCGGSFFDRGELKETLDRLLTSREVPEAPLKLDRRAVPVSRVQEPLRRCPRCGEQMEKFNYCYDSNIILDRCRGCGGIWADRGEVLKCAQYRKGNPELDRLGVSLAEYERHRQALRETAAWGGMLGPAYLGWLWWCLPALVPLRDDEPSRRTPVVTMALMVANAAVFAVMLLWVGVEGWRNVFETFGVVPERVAKGEQTWSLLTHMFLHVGLFHLLGNMLFLWIFGDNVEDRFGRLRFLGFYLGCGVAAALVDSIARAGSVAPAVGASGAVSGVMGAYFLFYPRASVQTLVFGTLTEIPAAVYIGIWIALQVLFAVLYSGLDVEGGVAWFAHIGGFAAGLAWAWVWERRRKALRVV